MSVACADIPDHGPRRCTLCGTPLTGRQQRWCSTECSDLYWSNHRWPAAKVHALWRAQRIGRSGGVRWLCARCGCTTTRPEVNHRRPARGAHGAISCAHHQDNLEVLCIPCHRAETRRQHAAGELGGRPRAPRPDQLALNLTDPIRRDAYETTARVLPSRSAGSGADAT